MHNDLTPPTDWTALARYLSGESEPWEADAIRRWIDAEPGRDELVDALRGVWSEAAAPREQWDVEGAVQKIVGGAPVVPIEIARRKRGIAWRWIARGVAAAAAIVVGLGLWRSAQKPAPASGAVAFREYTTPRGQYATVVLADGTRITLAPLSRLRAPRELDRGARDVYLEGQALFQVTHDARRPFRVHTTGAVATDLGTRFDVRAYGDTPRVRVVVTEGSVELASVHSATGTTRSSTPLILRAGDLGVVDTAGGLTVERGVPVDAYTAWSDGRLVFRLTPLREVAAELARWYDLDVRIPEAAVAERRVTASFRNEPAADVLRLIALSLDLEFTREGDAVVLRAKKPSSGR